MGRLARPAVDVGGCADERLPVRAPAARLTAVGEPPTLDAALLAVVLEAAPVRFAHYDRSGRFVHVNAALAAAHGAPADDHVGRTVREVAPGLADTLEPLVAQVLATGRTLVGVEVRGTDGRGTCARWTTSWYPLPDPAGGPCLGVAMVATDGAAGTAADPAAAEDQALQRTALTLQRSLLPAQLPCTEELEVAVRYLPGAAGTQVCGDWYDVIALGAGRLALVVGDVMGRGVPAAAVMGHLRTAARTCARLDLRPSEVLDVLDGVLRDLDQDAIATCVYAVFDPHARELRVASAGHPPPLLSTPRGTSPLGVEVAAPLGLSDPAGETTVRLQPGSVVVLYTDGMTVRRGRDLDQGIATLCRDVATGPADLEQLADQVMAGGTDGHDDAALLLVRVPEDVEARSRSVLVDVPRERTLMFDVRGQVRAAMRSWMLLDAVVDTATLLASELATNALVHGRGRVELRLRLTRDRLVIESVDSGHHMPRRRRPGDDAEGGRGLHLVAELADRGGCRATDGGKVVWAELDLA